MGFQVASTTWFLNFLSMAGVKKGHVVSMLDRIPDRNITENWEGEQGGMGIRALTRYRVSVLLPGTGHQGSY